MLLTTDGYYRPYVERVGAAGKIEKWSRPYNECILNRRSIFSPDLVLALVLLLFFSSYGPVRSFKWTTVRVYVHERDLN